MPADVSGVFGIWSVPSASEDAGWELPFSSRETFLFVSRALSDEIVSKEESSRIVGSWRTSAFSIGGFGFSASVSI